MVVNALVGSQQTWSSFCSVNQSTFEEHLAGALDAVGYEYSTTEGEGKFMLGTEPSTVFTVQTPAGATTITVYFASGDPLLRYLSSFRTDGSEAMKGVCVVKVQFDEGTAPHVQQVMAHTVEALPRDPHDVGHHPRFRLAPLAKWRIRRQWRRWTEPTSNHPNPT